MYSPALGSNEIRLLTIKISEDPTLRCHLQRAIRDEAVYDALSYTWGYPEQTETIICDGVSIRTAPALRKALYHMGLYQRKSQCPLWIDAICLDQNNPTEKEQQVPLMYEVYSHARNVIIWLGEADHNSDYVFDRLAYFRDELTAFRKTGEFGFPQPQDRFWSDLGALLHRPWFGRLWTLQEVVLARRKVVVCGRKFIEWTKLAEFLELTNLGDCRNTINQISARDPFRVNAFVSMGHSNTIADLKRTASTGQYILAVLNLARYRQCLYDVDHIYAVLGLLPAVIRTDIAAKGLVDYRLAPGELYTKIIRNYLLTPDVGLSLLSLPGSSIKKSMMPSWCPDWAVKPNIGRQLSDVPFYKAGISSRFDSALSAIKPGPEENQIVISGFCISTVKAVGIPWHTSGGEGPVNADDEDQLRKWEASCYQIAVETIEPSELLSTYLRTMIGNVTGAYPIPCTQDFSDEYRHFKHLNECPEEPCTHIHLDKAKYAMFCRSLGQHCTGRVFFSTAAGHVGMGPFKMQVGDLVYALLGGRPLFILRQSFSLQNSSKNFYELVGEAYVDGLMDGEALAILEEQQLEMCCLV